nr:MAG: polyprotein 2 [Picornavirales sp.]
MFAWEKPPPVNNNLESRNPPTSKGGTMLGGLYREAMDVANFWASIGGTLIVNVLSFYAICLVKEHFNPKVIEPEADEGNFPISQDSTVSQQQNVKFVNAHPGYSQSVDSTFDTLRDEALAGDASLQQFFARPIRIATYNWTINSDFYHNFNPWALYFQNLRVINRLSNYRLLRCKLHVRFTINGNGFYYGRALCSYNPFPNQDTLTVIRQFFEADLVAASQRPHIFLNPTLSQGGDLVLPFFMYDNVVDIVSQTWQNMGVVNMKSMQNLKHANGANTPVTVNVFAWAEDVKFAIPTQFEPGSIAPQADEYSQGPVSRVAGAIASKAKMLTTAPIIGPYARATELGAQCVGAVATLFGYSKPQILNVNMVQPKTKSNLAVTNAPEDSTKLTLDIKQELSIDPRTAGLGSEDEMSINYLASRESYLTNFEWPIGAVQEKLLFNAIVDPCLYNNVAPEFHFPACCFATMPFKFWRGTMKFRFQVVCSNFHKGRLKVVYDPVGTPPVGGVPPTSPSAEYNTAYTTIIDISDNTDFEIEVGWGQPTTYREHIPFPPTATLYDTAVLNYNATTFAYGNGTISVYVVNELTTPNSTALYNAEVNVFVSAGYGFEVAVPTAEYLSYMRFTPDIPPGDGLVAAQILTSLRQPRLEDYGDVVPQAQETMLMDAPPTTPGVLDDLANSIDANDSANLVHFGETVSSLRQLLKRYNLVEIVTPSDESFVTPGTQSLFQLYRYNMPLIGGFYPAITSPSPPIVHLVNAGVDPYVYAFQNMLHYVTLAYGGWRGGIRYFIDCSSTTSDYLTGVTIDRVQRPGYPANLLLPIGDLLAVNPKGVLHDRLNELQGLSGAAIQGTVVNSTISFEVPYYSKYRFAPAKRLTSFHNSFGTNPEVFQNGWTLGLKGAAMAEGATLCIYASAAEDFTTFMFLGAPRIFAEPSFPEV